MNIHKVVPNFIPLVYIQTAVNGENTFVLNRYVKYMEMIFISIKEDIEGERKARCTSIVLLNCFIYEIIIFGPRFLISVENVNVRN